MMLILSHIHFKNNFPAIYRAQKASLVCVSGTLVSLYERDKVLYAKLSFLPLET